MGKLLQDNYGINKKSTLGVKVDDFYTKEHEENLKFFDTLENFKDELARAWTFDVSGNKEKQEKSYSGMHSIIDKHCKKKRKGKKSFLTYHELYKDIIQNGGIPYPEEQIELSPFLDTRGYDTSPILNTLAFEWQDTTIDFDISVYSGLEKFLDFIDWSKKMILLKQNGFVYNPHLKKYINTIYAGNFLNIFGFLSNYTGDIDETVVENIQSFLPEGIGEVKKQSKILHQYPETFTSFLEITLQSGEKVELVACENNLFFMVHEYTKEVYCFFRKLYIKYINAYRQNVSKKVIAILDFSTTKSKIQFLKDYAFTNVSVSLLKEDFKEVFGCLVLDFECHRKLISTRQSKKEVSVLKLGTILLNSLYKEYNNMGQAKKYFSTLRKEKGSALRELKQVVGLVDYILDGTTPENTQGVVEKDIKALKKGENIDWYKYAFHFGHSTEDCPFIGQILDYVKASKNNFDKKGTGRCITHNQDFQKAAIQAAGIDILEVLQDHDIEDFCEQMVGFFGGVEEGIIQSLVNEVLQHKTLKEVSEWFLLMLESLLNEKIPIENFEYLKNNTRIKEILYFLRSDQRMNKIYMSLSDSQRAELIKDDREERLIENDIQALNKGEDIDWFRYDIDMFGKGGHVLGVSKDFFVNPIRKCIEKSNKNLPFFHGKIDVRQNYGFQIACFYVSGVDILDILKNFQIHYLEGEISRFFQGIDGRLIPFLLEEALQKKSEQERVCMVLDMVESGLQYTGKNETFAYLKSSNAIKSAFRSAQNDKRFIELCEKSSADIYISILKSNATFKSCF